jgi:hypothetical protein
LFFFLVKVFEEAICAGLGHKKFGGKDFISECLELFDDNMKLFENTENTTNNDTENGT